MSKEQLRIPIQLNFNHAIPSHRTINEKVYVNEEQYKVYKQWLQNSRNLRYKESKLEHDQELTEATEQIIDVVVLPSD